MKFKAALLLLSLLMAAPAQAQYNLSVDEMMDRRDSGVPILDPKLELLIAAVDYANFRAVDFHNDKLIEKVRESGPIDTTWALMHTSLVARWTAWDELYQAWFVKKKVEASASIAVSGGAKKVRDMKTVEVQNRTLLRWRSVRMQVGQLEENKGLLGDMDGFDKLWSEWLSRLDKLNKAIDALRKY
jgi:hypothetical protein